MPLSAAIRELAEETGLSGRNWQLLGESDFDYADRSLHFYLFRCDCNQAEPAETEGLYSWAAPETLVHYAMPEANRAFIPQLAHTPE